MKKQTFFTATEKDREHLLAFVQAVPLDKRLTWSVEELKAGRSAQQNRLYHKWAKIIADHSGHSPGEVKEYLKREFLTPKIVEMNGKTIEIYSTTKLKVAEMSEYLDKINAFAISEGLYLPHPEDQHMRNAG